MTASGTSPGGMRTFEVNMGATVNEAKDRPRSLLLFVHGLGGSKDTWGRFSSLIKADKELTLQFEIEFYKYPTSLFRIPFGRVMPNIQTLARGLKTQIDNSFRDYENIVLVCHSLGGLIARKYVLEEVKRKSVFRVRKLILFGVPNNGAELASIGNKISWRHNQLKQLCSSSDFMEDLNNDWTHFQTERHLIVKYVIGGQDNVVPAQSGRGYWGNANVETIVDKGHRDLVKPKDLKDQAYLILKNFVLEDFQNEKGIPANRYEAPFSRPRAIPLDGSSLSAYVNGNPRVRDLNQKLARRLEKELDDDHSLGEHIKESLPKFGISTITELDDLLKEKTDLILDIAPYAPPQGKIDRGYSLEVLTHVLGAKLGVEKYTEILESCEYTSGNHRIWAEEMLKAYQQINGARNQPIILAQLALGISKVGDFTPACAVRITNTGPDLDGKCLVQLEDHGCANQMPDPLVIRTDGQIRGGRTGRFTLSRGQPKFVPILFREPNRKNQFRFIGEDGSSYSFTGNSAEFVLAIYGAATPVRVLIRLWIGTDWMVNAELETC